MMMNVMILTRSFSSKCLLLFQMTLRVLHVQHHTLEVIDMVNSSSFVRESCIIFYCSKIISLRIQLLELSNSIGNLE